MHGAAYGLALLPVLTDWIDTGHWPHPRELATEMVLGALILFGVRRLHRRAEHYRSTSRRCATRDSGCSTFGGLGAKNREASDSSSLRSNGLRRRTAFGPSA